MNVFKFLHHYLCDKPCYEGVKCYETRFGVRCGPCPDGFDGNGFYCEKVKFFEQVICLSNADISDRSPVPMGLVSMPLSALKAYQASSAHVRTDMRVTVSTVLSWHLPGKFLFVEDFLL